MLGASLKEIAEQMSKTGPTYDAGKSWTQNMVARILENSKYIGVDSYPKLVDIKLFEAAAAKRELSSTCRSERPRRKRCGVCAKPPTPEIEQQITSARQTGGTARAYHAAGDSKRTQHSTTQADLDSVLNTQPLDEEAARSLIFRLAQEQYDAIGNAEYETERLRRLFAALRVRQSSTQNCCKCRVRCTGHTTNGAPAARNGQIIGKDELT